MRFCFVLPEFDENKNSFSKLLVPVIERLLMNGDDVTILSANRSYCGRYKLNHVASNLPNLKIGVLKYLAFLIFSTLWLIRNRHRFDVVHNLGVGTTLYQNIMTAHACHRSWVATKMALGQYPSLIFNPLHALVLLVEGINYRRNIPVIAVCETLAEQIKRYYPTARNRIVVVPNGIPARDFPLPPKPSHPRITFASNDHGKKGLGELLDALVLAKKNKKNWELSILGQDLNQAYWESVVAAKGLSLSVTFYGHVNSIQNYLAQSTVFCLPSYYESFGLVFLEAAQIGIPVVGTDVGIYADLVGDTFPGLPLTVPAPPAKLYAVLDKVISDPDFALILSSKTTAESKKYTEDSMVEGIMRVYKRSSFK